MRKTKLTNNLSLKLLALVTSILLWLVIINVSDPIKEIPISGVPVTILNGDVISDQGKVYQVLEGTDTVTVNIAANRSILNAIGKDNLKATADMTELNEEDGTVRIRVESSKYNDKIDSLKSKTEYLKVKIEDSLKSQIEITTNITGTPAEGYVVGDVTTDQNVIRIQGPESVISTITDAVVDLSVEGMSRSISTSVDIRLYDKNGNQVKSSAITENITTVSIRADILATKEVPVTWAVGGTPAEGYGLTGNVNAEPETVLLAGKNSILQGISEIQIPESALNVSGMTTDMTTRVNIANYLPDNTRFGDPDFDGKVSVSVGIGKQSKMEYEVKKASVQIKGLPENMTGTIAGSQSTIELSLMGMPDDLEKVTADEIAASVDLAEYMAAQELTHLKEGNYEVPLKLSLPEGMSTEKDPVVIVKITEK